MAMRGDGQQEENTPTHYLVEEEYTIGVPMVRPKHAFLNLLHLAGAKGEVFTKKEIVQYLKDYIRSRQMFDLVDPSIVHCDGDLLGDVFGVTQFTIDEVLQLLDKNCIPVPDTCLKKRRQLVRKPLPTSVTISNIACNVTSGEKCDTTISVSSNKKTTDIPHTKSRLSSSSSLSDKQSSEGPSVSNGNQISFEVATGSGVKNDDEKAPVEKKKHKKKKRKNKNKSDEEPSRKRHHTEPIPGPSLTEPGPSQSTRRRGTSVSITYGDDGPDVGEGYPWYVKLDFTDGKHGDGDDDDRSEVLSVHDKETVRIEDSTDDLWFLDEDSTAISVEVQSDNFSIEYDIESDTTPMSESDRTSIISSEGLVVVCKDSDVEFFADYSESDSNDEELTEADNWCCADCKNVNHPLQRYCGKCWKVRKDWLPSQQLATSKTDLDEPVHKSKLFEKVQALADSGISSVSSTQPSSQESVVSDISAMKNDSVFCDQSYLTESQLDEKRYSMSNIQMKSTSSPEEPIYSNRQPPEDKVTGNTPEELCMICLSRPKTASLIHGTSGHQVCCYTCAKRLRRQGKVCPVCRRPIQKVIRNYIL